MPDRKILVNDVRVQGIGKTNIPEDPVLPTNLEPARSNEVRRQISMADQISYQAKSFSNNKYIHILSSLPLSKVYQ